RHVEAKLVFLLSAINRKGRDGGEKLIVAKSFKSRSGDGGGTERESEGQSEIGIAHLMALEAAGLERERAQPLRIENKLPVNQETVIVRARGGAGGRERALLHEI